MAIFPLRRSWFPSLMAQLDYAENYPVRFQNEVGAIYYNKQITVLPIVIYYKNAEGEVCHMTFGGITEETSHQAPTTFTFIKALMSYLKLIPPTLSHVHFVSDSPSSQFRNRTICAIIAKFHKFFGVNASWNWLESGHGKGPCDGVGGALKKLAANLVKSNVVICDTKEFCNALEMAGVKTRLIQVSTAAIAREKEYLNTWKIPPGKQISDKHVIITAGGKTKSRNLPCYGDCCYRDPANIELACEGWGDCFAKLPVLPDPQPATPCEPEPVASNKPPEPQPVNDATPVPPEPQPVDDAAPYLQSHSPSMMPHHTSRATARRRCCTRTFRATARR